MHRNILRMSFVCFLLLSIMFIRFIHVEIGRKTLFILSLWSISLYEYATVYLTFIDVFFQVLLITNSLFVFSLYVCIFVGNEMSSSRGVHKLCHLLMLADTASFPKIYTNLDFYWEQTEVFQCSTSLPTLVIFLLLHFIYLCWWICTRFIFYF